MFAAGVFDLGDGPFAALGMHKVAYSAKLVFEGTEEGLLLDGGNDGFFGLGDARDASHKSPNKIW